VFGKRASRETVTAATRFFPAKAVRAIAQSPVNAVSNQVDPRGRNDRMDSKQFDGRVVLVTGGASGIGFGIAQASAEQGAVVHIVDVDGASAAEAADKLTEAGHRANAHVCDVGDGEAVRELFDAVVAASGRIDHVFLNAGINRTPNMINGGGIDELSAEAWERVMSVNFKGVLHGFQQCARIMKKQRGGSIVVTASTAGTRAEPFMSYPYVVSKHAVVGLVRQASLELARFGVRVNAIAPGPVHTNIGGPGPRPPEMIAAVENHLPLRRWAQPAEIAATALFLASDAASYTTGGIHVIDAGGTVLSQFRSDELPAPKD
jgi:NAD(P)-dependent dehydrogenase (short-subunit alcohol dehydrogenase family)